MIHAFLRRWHNGYYRLCGHRSHRLRLRCYRPFHWDGWCAKHVESCEYSPTWRHADDKAAGQ